MNILAIVGLIIAISSVILAIYTFVNTHRKTHFIWGLFSLSVALWGFGIYNFSSASEIHKAVFWWRVAEVGVIFIPVFLTHFVYEFLGKRKDRLISLLYILAFIFIYLDIFTNNFFGELRFAFGQLYYITPTNYYTLFVLLFLILAIHNINILYKDFRRRSGVLKNQLKYLILAFVVGFSGGATSFLPVYGIDIYPVYNITIFVSVLVVAYSIFRHQLLDIKTLTVQFLVFGMWFFLFGRILLSQDWRNRMIDSILFASMLFFGTLIIRSVLKEVQLREQMQGLAKELENANVRLRKLDQAKSEFITIASHQLRAPITAIKGYSSMLLEGSFGKMPDKAREALTRIFQSSNRLVLLINDFLNLSRIERGKIEYVYEELDLEDMIRSIVEEFSTVNIEKERPLELKFTVDNKGNFKNIKVDRNKMRQVISNLIDNSIKYTPKGFVKVYLYRNPGNNNTMIKVEDSGIGMNKETLSRIFQKFTRAKPGIFQFHTEGTGLGLFLAKEIVAHHGGKVWAESRGEGKGSSFYVELPEKFVPPEEIKKIEKERELRKENVKEFIKNI